LGHKYLAEVFIAGKGMVPVPYWSALSLVFFILISRCLCLSVAFSLPISSPEDVEDKLECGDIIGMAEKFETLIFKSVIQGTGLERSTVNIMVGYKNLEILGQEIETANVLLARNMTCSKYKKLRTLRSKNVEAAAELLEKLLQQCNDGKLEADYFYSEQDGTPVIGHISFQPAEPCQLINMGWSLAIVTFVDDPETSFVFLSFLCGFFAWNIVLATLIMCL
jgi:hypothetical protein